MIQIDCDHYYDDKIPRTELLRVSLFSLLYCLYSHLVLLVILLLYSVLFVMLTVVDCCTLHSALSSKQNILSVGVITYEALIGAGALKAEHTAVDEVMAAVSRYRTRQTIQCSTN